ncbi:heterodisulfide reductase subunit B [Thermanaeromonas toyohensis ToBE]|uniref:Heterodisulfide reductase subunit B n=1 Tax=Thermanaeromonas toyohensis ToBE TaxID=698762 RepID=A0A1W1VXM7_9FIRM|nr:CoB--CoM heterodisulfide reductase iron-sulfur subunit B family protein [Thermanaeromonas toyohensis]SMB98088.1 heterodisulfide reductase subunit B [Thermanaeromonas toyohensis ToBE]
MLFGYYPGCSLHSTAAEYDASTRAVFQALNIPLKEVPDWNCCGATSGHSLNTYLSHSLALRNLVLAEGVAPHLVVPCAACYNALRSTQAFLESGEKEAKKLKEDINSFMGREYKGVLKVHHLLEVLGAPEVLSLLKEKQKVSLAGLKPAAYYGCLLTRPPKIVNFEANAEQPQLMDRLLKALGAEPVSWSHKTECCGASLSIPAAEIVYELVKKIVQAAVRAGANVLVTACPLCQTNLDTRQPEGYNLPVLYISEILGLALGISAPWLNKHIIDPSPVLKSCNLSLTA